MIYSRNRLLISISVCAVAFMVIFSACSDNSRDSGGVPKAGENGPPAVDQGVESSHVPAPAPSGKVPADWKEASYDEFRFSIPSDWQEESGTGVWFPGTESFAMGMPDISLQCGSMPIMPGQTVDGQIRELLHGSDPASKEPVEKCGMEGHNREALDEFGLRHIALTLEEQAGGGMIMVHFFNCRVPAAEYSEYAEVFKKILESVRCN